MPGAKHPTKPAQTIFFLEQAMKAPEAFRLHIAWGVWDPIDGLGPDNNRDLTSCKWNNVTEHCLMAMTRGEMLAEMLQLPANLKSKLMNALALHDISKPEEVIYAKQAGGITWDSYEEVTKKTDAKLKRAGFDEETILLSSAMGHPSLLQTETLLQKTEHNAHDFAYLIAHYCDDISVKAEWCESAANISGKKVNQLDRRMERNINNPNITQLGEEGRSWLNGRHTFDAQREIGHAVEMVLAAELNNKYIRVGDSLDLPEFLDNKIKAKIQAIG